MSIVKGRDLRIYIGSQPVAYATNCTIQFQKEMIELAPSSAASSSWARFKGRRKSCTIGFSALYGAHATSEDLGSLFDSFDADTDLNIEFKYLALGEWNFSGTAKLSDLGAQAAVTEDGAITGNLIAVGQFTKAVQ